MSMQYIHTWNKYLLHTVTESCTKHKSTTSSPSQLLQSLSFITLPRSQHFSSGNFIKWRFEHLFLIQVWRMHSYQQDSSWWDTNNVLLFKSCLMKSCAEVAQGCQWTNGNFLPLSFLKIFRFPFSFPPICSAKPKRL